MTHHPLLGAARPGSLFARRAGRAITMGAFLGDVAALAAVLPASQHVVNLCHERYRFAVGFGAALCRRQVSLLPPSDSAGVLDQLALDYPDLYCLADTTPPAGPRIFRYPSELIHPTERPETPYFPADQPAAVLFTSGSVGRPQPHARRWGDLVTSTLAAGRRLGAAALGQASLLGTVPHQHSYGLESLVMLALQHGLVLHAERPFYPADIVTELAAAPHPRVLVTTPIHARILLADPGDLPSVELLLSATAPLSIELAGQAEKRFAAELYEIYGCTEAGQIATRRTALTQEWHCLEGVALRQDGAGTWASGTPIAEETLLSDAIELHDTGRFRLHGRLADMVNVAGKRTSLSHLNHHINAIKGVVDGVFIVPEGAGEAVTRLAAFAVAPGLSAGDILRALRRQIDPAFLPRPLLLVGELPRNALGKLPSEEVKRLLAKNRAAIRRKS